jgi:ATP-binding cassette subfamily B protein
MKSFPFIHQLDASDCGPACLAMIARYYGKTYPIQKLRESSFITRAGVSMLGISDAVEAIGFKTIGAKISYDTLVEEATLPCIAHWRQNHFVVIYKIKKDKVYVADPGHGLVRYTKKEFLDGWVSTTSKGEDQGICLFLEPTNDFFLQGEEKQKKSGFGFLFSYLRPHKRFLFQLVLGMVLGSLLQLIFPFLTQAIVDIGISNQNIGFVTLVLIAQLVLFLSQSAVEFVRGWILLHISTRINVALISDFLIKLLRLPLGFFDSKMIGDILQRISDHSRIQSFLTSTSLSILFSLVNLLIFGLVLAFYNLNIFAIFLIGSAFYVTWVVLFMKKRRDLDFKRFQQLSKNQSNLFQLITGIQEIKLNNCERQQRWNWERIQAKLFKISIKSLSLNQYQQSGSIVIDQLKNILISFVAARAVIQGQMTLGMMLAVQYIIGQMNSPISQLIGFLQSTQDAKISLERLHEIHDKKDEENPDDLKITLLPENKSLAIAGLGFQYEGPHSEWVLQDIDLAIPQGQTSAIVGVSGSGKTTLIKLLLGFYPPGKGEIRVGEYLLENLQSRVWRQSCGVVMQDGFMFSDTIAQNIAISGENIDKEKLLQAVRVANIQEYIEALPLGYNTVIGMEGHGLSAGQKQRLLIARAVYKDPQYIFFDEATNALDANNERIIIENLRQFFHGRTVVIVAHRLSTVKDADNIVVLDKGRIVEKGTHAELIGKKGPYFNLVKDQLTLGCE